MKQVLLSFETEVMGVKCIIEVLVDGCVALVCNLECMYELQKYCISFQKLAIFYFFQDISGNSGNYTYLIAHPYKATYCSSVSIAIAIAAKRMTLYM